MHTEIRFNKYMPAALLYFFFNGFLLPLGLLYTTLLTPLFLLWIYKYPSFRYIYYLIIFFIPFLLVHLAKGVYPPSYLKSGFLLFSVFVFCLAFYQFLENCRTIRTIYRNILLFNAVMVVVALFALAIPHLKNIFWYANEITSGVQRFDCAC